MDTLERMPFKAQKAVFDKLLEVADVANLSKDERVLYDEALKRYRDYKNTIDYAEEKVSHYPVCSSSYSPFWNVDIAKYPAIYTFR